MKTVILLSALALLAAGCSDLTTREHAEELSASRADNDACVAQGLHYPDPAYVTCRYGLQNERLRRQWRNVQMLQSAGKPAPAGVSGADFRPLDRGRFECRPEPQFGGDYVFCGEDEGPAKP